MNDDHHHTLHLDYIPSLLSNATHLLDIDFI